MVASHNHSRLVIVVDNKVRSPFGWGLELHMSTLLFGDVVVPVHFKFVYEQYFPHRLFLEDHVGRAMLQLLGKFAHESKLPIDRVSLLVNNHVADESLLAYKIPLKHRHERWILRAIADS